MPETLTSTALEALRDLMRGRRTVVLSGAGCSTESGIPDYRGPTSKPRSPIQYGEFTRDPLARARYWARSAVGWPRFAASVPNAGHVAIARLEEVGSLRGVITQNVDGLHQAAGSRRVVELHGSLSRVCCLGCDARFKRDDVQQRLIDANPDWAVGHLVGDRRVASNPADIATAHVAPSAVGSTNAHLASNAVDSTIAHLANSVPSAPDGDAELGPEAIRGFQVPACEHCGGVLKPDVVFFGENVPKDRVTEAWDVFAEADVLLVVGSSLEVFSGRRFVIRAVERGVPVAIVNQGPTRVDDVARVRVEGRLGEILPRLAE